MYLGGRGAAATSAPTATAAALDEATARELGDQVEVAWRALVTAQVRFTEAVRRLDRSQSWAADGSLSSAAWLRRRCHLTHSQAAQQVMVARRLEELPATAAAYQATGISYQHAAVIAGSARRLGTEVVREHEEVLVAAAEQMDPFRLSLVTDHLEHMADPDGSLGFFERKHERRRLELSRTQDGMYSLRGIFDAEAGAIISTGLESVLGPPASDDVRPVWQRRADAMVEVFERHLTLEKRPERGGERPRLTVISELGTLRKLAGAPGGELGDQLMVPAETVRRIACDAIVEFAEVHPDGIRVDLGRQRRAISGPLRRQLVVRDGGCRFPGCDRPPSWTDGHHLRHWADGGPTVLENLALLCRRHHYWLHEGGMRLEWGAHGELRVRPP